MEIAADSTQTLLAAAAERELGQDQRGRGQRRPGRGPATFGIEGKAADPDGPGASREPGRLLADRLAAQAPAGHVEEAIRPARGHLAGDAEGCQGEAPIRLLPAEPAV